MYLSPIRTISELINGQSHVDYNISDTPRDVHLPLLSSEHSHHQLLLFDQESSHDSFTHTLCTSWSSVRTRHGLLGSWQCRKDLGSDGFHATELLFTVTTFGCSTGLLCVQVDEFTSRCLRDTTAVGFGVVGETTAEYQTSHFCWFLVAMNSWNIFEMWNMVKRRRASKLLYCIVLYCQAGRNAQRPQVPLRSGYIQNANGAEQSRTTTPGCNH